MLAMRAQRDGKHVRRQFMPAASGPLIYSPLKSVRSPRFAQVWTFCFIEAVTPWDGISAEAHPVAKTAEKGLPTSYLSLRTSPSLTQ